MNRAATRDLRVHRGLAGHPGGAGRARRRRIRAPPRRCRSSTAGARSGSSRTGPRPGWPRGRPGAAVMDAAFEPMANAVLRPVLGSRLLSRLARLHERDRAPYKDDVNGSSFGSGWYGYVDKDLRRLLGRPVRGKFGLRYCGGAPCRAAGRRCGRRCARPRAGSPRPRAPTPRRGARTPGSSGSASGPGCCPTPRAGPTGPPSSRCSSSTRAAERRAPRRRSARRAAHRALLARPEAHVLARGPGLAAHDERGVLADPPRE